ncbi:Na+/H+-translocating membrane pyrophosphatase [Glycomyces algeriensis]|nr:sodium/proton-translocating pyrophosphatase [Glycomyces algeriensis]MDA1364781.1 sodium/proton-translocating pyrophosphatase [Glycomyces algeriensis]MDR7350822.1 Na+/H+-translocating membrane pyrophosphatase [Glycomyces algeriensis]
MFFFIVGALFSSFIGRAGMNMAARANVRVAAAARDGQACDRPQR